jgi:hypothetical protein
LNRAGGGTMDIELMLSRDGLEWERPFRDRYFIARSGGDAFDSGTVLTNSDFIIEGNEMRFYYGAYSSGAIGGGSNITSDAQKSGVGLATLPLNRFAGIRTEPEAPTPKIKNPPDIGQITFQADGPQGAHGIVRECECCRWCRVGGEFSMRTAIACQDSTRRTACR